jgi:excisionase family DNA binding protein
MPQEKILEYKKPYRFAELLDEKQLASVLNQTPRTIRSWRHAGKIPFYRIGYRSLRFNLSHVVAALQRYEVQTISTAAPLRKGGRK